MVEVSDVHQKVLRRVKSADEFNLYRAGLEWDLVWPAPGSEDTERPTRFTIF